MNSHKSPDSRDRMVSLIFSKCGLIYGREFSGRWEGINEDEVRADWKRELGAVLDKPQAVMHALTHLPDDKPPTVLQFRKLCINRPIAFVPALPAPDVTPARKLEVRAMLGKARRFVMGGAA